KPHALSETGWLSHFASHDAVQALGGPEAYAAAYAEAVLAERDHEFEAVFNGPRPAAGPRRQKPATIITVKVPGREVVGEHTAQAAVEEKSPREDVKPAQPSLF